MGMMGRMGKMVRKNGSDSSHPSYSSHYSHLSQPLSEAVKKSSSSSQQILHRPPPLPPNHPPPRFRRFRMTRGREATQHSLGIQHSEAVKKSNASTAALQGVLRRPLPLPPCHPPPRRRR